MIDRAIRPQPKRDRPRRAMAMLLGAGLALAAVTAFSLNKATSQGPPQAVRLSAQQLAGGIFNDFEVLVEHHAGQSGPYKTEDVEALLADDRRFVVGVYRSEAVREVIEAPYPVDEFMYFLEGGVTLTAADGTVARIGAGDAVVIPRGWMGVWDTEGYTKIYAIYSREPF